mmetsp:Transcript_24117/g.48708  ORF Transcript_24117/g.48708 Transcript_24117/m.48708 type:complete len:249 (+) Transcript_24117:2201-2947(+)
MNLLSMVTRRCEIRSHLSWRRCLGGGRRGVCMWELRVRRRVLKPFLSHVIIVRARVRLSLGDWKIRDVKQQWIECRGRASWCCASYLYHRDGVIVLKADSARTVMPAGGLGTPGSSDGLPRDVIDSVPRHILAPRFQQAGEDLCSFHLVLHRLRASRTCVVKGRSNCREVNPGMRRQGHGQVRTGRCRSRLRWYIIERCTLRFHWYWRPLLHRVTERCRRGELRIGLGSCTRRRVNQSGHHWNRGGVE